jgi:hypothetical protein
VIAFGDLGDFASFSALQFFMFMLFTFFIPLTLMNMLIAIMSDTYSRVQANAISSDARALADMILEMEQLYRFFGVRSDPSQEKNSSYFLFFTEWLGVGEEGDAVWEGMVGSLKAIIAGHSGTILKSIKSLKKKNKSITSKLNKKVEEIQQDTAESKKEVAAILSRIDEIQTTVASK